MAAGYPDTNAISEMLGQAIEAAREGQRAQENAAGQTVEKEAANGQIRVTATLAGNVKVQIVDPRAIRLGAEVLGEEITKAVNEALTAAREQAGVPGNIDLGGLAEKAEEIQKQSVAQLRSFMTSLTEAHTRVIQSTDDGRDAGEERR
ncbi:MAG TPA: YbaB/EbfC family nucleoid-associated protein [Glycomyces sp.]